MKMRCYNKNNPEYYLYGERGITICDEWLNDSSSFYKWAYDNGYDENLTSYQCTIDRIDVNGGYSPDNCRWVSVFEQANNTRKNIRFEIEGETRTLAEWARHFNVDYHKLYNRVVTRGIPIENAVKILSVD